MSKCFFLTSLSALVFLFLSGCGFNVVSPSADPSPYLKEMEPPPSGKIGVISVEFSPKADFPEPESAIGWGASAGRTASFIGCGAVIDPRGWDCIALFVLGGAAAGAAYSEEPASASSSGTPEKAHAALEDAFRGSKIQKSFEAHIVKHGKKVDLNIVSLPQAGPKNLDDPLGAEVWRQESVDIVIETALLQVGMHRTRRFSPESMLSLTARIRVFRRSARQIAHESEYRFLSPPLTDAQWLKNDRAAFRLEFSRGLKDLAQQITDRLFLVYDPPGWRWDRQEHYGLCVYVPLRPQYPIPEERGVRVGLDVRSTCSFCGIGWSESEGYNPFSPVDSLQPTLRWEAFPSVADREADPKKELEHIKNVEYDVRVFQAVRGQTTGWVPGDLVIERTVGDRKYRVKESLKACTRYLWTYRARFDLANYTRATEWAGAYHPVSVDCTSDYRGPLPPRTYYPFMTPCSKARKESTPPDSAFPTRGGRDDSAYY